MKTLILNVDRDDDFGRTERARAGFGGLFPGRQPTFHRPSRPPAGTTTLRRPLGESLIPQ